MDGRSLQAAPVKREVRLGRLEEAAVVAPPEAVARGVLATAREQRVLFGEGDESLYRFGPRPDLIGRAVARVHLTTVQDADVVLAEESELAAVKKSSGYLPVHLLGRLTWRSLRPGESLAIAVNGRVAAVTTSYRSNGDSWFSTLIDEAVLHEGSNSVDVFAVRGNGRRTRLLHLGGTAPPADPVQAAG